MCHLKEIKMQIVCYLSATGRGEVRDMELPTLFTVLWFVPVDAMRPRDSHSAQHTPKGDSCNFILLATELISK